MYSLHLLLKYIIIYNVTFVINLYNIYIQNARLSCVILNDTLSLEVIKLQHV